MLCLSRKTHETILIGDDIRITVVRIWQNGRQPRVSLAIAAPDDTRIDREEVRARILADGLL